MKNLVKCLTAGLLMSLCNPYVPKVTASDISASTVSSADAQIAAVYDQIDFTGSDTLAYEAFKYAYTGYLNLAGERKLNMAKPILTVCDFTLSSSKNRMWVIDMQQKKVLLNTYVAHGQGSGEEFAVAFSNKMNSHQSSIGFYVTGATYNGEHGNSLYLHGMDNGYNNAAYERNIVVHGADYVSPGFISSNDRLGRSWGCPAVASKLANKTIDLIKDGTCMFIYYPQKQYLASAKWLKPATNVNEWQFASVNVSKEPKVVYEYGPLTKEVMAAAALIHFPLF